MSNPTISVYDNGDISNSYPAYCVPHEYSPAEVFSGDGSGHCLYSADMEMGSQDCALVRCELVPVVAEEGTHDG